MSASNSPSVIFCYDIVCPYAYIASRRIEATIKEANPKANIIWTPVLLGGLYKLDAAPQGKDGSASAIMGSAKKSLMGRDLLRNATRFNVPLNFHPEHPLRSVSAMRLLTATPHEKRPSLTHELYESYWVRNADITSPSFLESLARKYGVDPASIESYQTKDALVKATKLASDRGAFGVPSFFVRRAGTGSSDEDLQFFFGQDRLPFVAHAVGGPKQLARSSVPRLLNPPRTKVKFYMDFASPWTFLGHTQISQLRQLADVEYVPVLVGALFKSVGMANTPMTLMTDRKRQYASKDLRDWSEWWNESVVWPEFFPIRTVLPLRIAIIEPKVIDRLFRAAWQEEKDIGDETMLSTVLSQAGFDASKLIAQASTPETKARLKANNDSALAAGVFGVPSYQVGEELVWGQDRIDVVMDLCQGWKPPPMPTKKFNDKGAVTRNAKPPSVAAVTPTSKL